MSHPAAARRTRMVLVLTLLALALLALTQLAIPGAAASETYLELRERFLPGIKGTDQRHLVESNEAPWRAIGRVNRRIGGYCTGTLIAPGHVLTAAHCLWNKRTRRWLGPEALHFVGGYQRGDWIADSGVRAIRLAPKSASGPDAKGHFAPVSDWAVLTLEKPLDTLGSIPLGDAPAAGDSLVQVGYSQDKPHILTAHDGCTPLAAPRPDRVLIHDCDATHGDSGSPILMATEAGPRVVAMHVATGRGPDGAIGFAVPASAIDPGR